MRLILLNPGPVNVSPRVRRALERTPDLCHREREVSEKIASIRERLVRCFGVSRPAATTRPPGGEQYSAAVLTGSGSLAVEAMIASGVGRGALLVLNNGVYGQRIADMARAHEIPVVEVVSPWAEPLQVDRLEIALREHPSIEAVAVVHHETTTGLLNPIREIGEAARRHGKRLLVDSVSGLAGDEIDLARDGVALCAGTANKCIQGIPGISFVLVRRDELEAISAHPRRSVYLHLPSHVSAQDSGSMLFTMAVQVAFACDEALAELMEESVPGRIQRYRSAAHQLRAGFARLGLECWVPEGSRSNTLTALRLPPAIRYATLHDQLKARGFVIYEGQGRLQSEVFRVANMGHLTQDDFGAFLEALATVLSEAGRVSSP